MLYEQIAQNKRRTVYVMIGFLMLVLAIGAALGYLFMQKHLDGCDHCGGLSGRLYGNDD